MQCWSYQVKDGKMLIYKGSESRFGSRLPINMEPNIQKLYAKLQALYYIGEHGYPSTHEYARLILRLPYNVF